MVLFRAALLSILLIFSFQARVAALDRPQYASSFLILPAAVNRDEEDTYSSLFYNLMSFELKSAGVQVLSSNAVSANTAANIVTSTGDADKALIFELGSEKGADFVLSCLYEWDTGKMQISFSCFDIKNSQMVKSISKKVQLDLSFDTIIAESVHSILDAVEDSLVLAAHENETAESEKLSDNGTSRKSEQTAGTYINSEEEKAVRDLTPVETSQIPAGSKDKRIALSAGYSPFFPVGRASDYFDKAQMPTLTAVINMYVSVYQIRIGLYGAFCSFKATGTLATSENMLIPAGLNLEFTGNGIERTSFLMRISGGPAIFGVDIDSSGYIYKILPFALATLGTSFSISNTFELLFELSFAAFFEPDYPIMGYMPGIRFLISP